MSSIGSPAPSLCRSAFFGRADELAMLEDSLATGGGPLVTVTGRGGVGKSHLVAVAAQRAANRGRRVLSVDLSSVGSPQLVMPAVAAMAGVRASTGNDAIDDVVRALGSSPTLLVMENVEHVAAAAAEVVSLLDRCPELSVWATSRTPLRLVGERRLRLGGLDADSGATSAAVAMFVDRAKAVDARFTPTEEDLGHIADMCRLVDGLPLAIELLATRVLTIPVDVLHHEVGAGSLLDLGSVSRGDQPDRHASLRRTVEWSVRLLASRDAALFRRLAVFSGPFTFAAVAQVCPFGVLHSSDVIDALTTLVDVHLVEPRHAPGEAAYSLLAEVRAYALESLGESAELDTLRARHAAWAHTLVARRGIRYDTPQADERSNALAGYEPELVAAARHTADHDDADRALDIANALAEMWVTRGPFPGHVATFDLLRRDADGADPRRRAEGLLWASRLRSRSSADPAQREEIKNLLDDARSIAAGFDDPSVLLMVCAFEFWAVPATADMTRLARAVTEGRELSERVGDIWWQGRFEVWAAMAAHQQSDVPTAATFAGIALQRCHDSGDTRTLIRAAIVLRTVPGGGADLSGVPTGAELLDLARATRDRVAMLWLYPLVASTAHGTAQPSAMLAAGLELLGSDGDWPVYTVYVAGLIAITARAGSDDAAARLYGTLTPVIPQLNLVLSPAQLYAHQAVIAGVRNRLGEGTFRALVDEGGIVGDRYGLALEVARQYARTPAPASPPASTAPGLTTREFEVLGLLARGQTNKDIAQTLGIRAKTVMHHTVAIYRKLDVRGRGEAAAWLHRELAVDRPPSR